jgi:hypothetical protein
MCESLALLPSNPRVSFRIYLGTDGIDPKADARICEDRTYRVLRIELPDYAFVNGCFSVRAVPVCLFNAQK